MDHAADLVPVLCLHRDAVTVAPHGDDGILQIRAHRAVDQAVQRGVDLFIDAVHAAPDPFQSGTGVVADLLLAENTAVDLIGQRGQRFQLFKIGVQTVRRFLLGVVPPIGFRPPGVLQKLTDPQQLPAA